MYVQVLSIQTSKINVPSIQTLQIILLSIQRLGNKLPSAIRFETKWGGR